MTYILSVLLFCRYGGKIQESPMLNKKITVINGKVTGLQTRAILPSSKYVLYFCTDHLFTRD